MATFKRRVWGPNEALTHDDMNRLEEGLENAFALIEALTSATNTAPATQETARAGRK